jgi:hypothetical protein
VFVLGKVLAEGSTSAQVKVVASAQEWVWVLALGWVLVLGLVQVSVREKG